MTRRLDMWLRTFALLLFLVAVFFYSWNSDDAYHSYIMARHLVEGKGLVYNTGYRVTASTCPLLTLIEAFVFLFTDSADVCGLLIGLLFSGAAAWVLFFRICPSPLSAFCMLGLVVSSRCFLSFTTSGLENPLLFFFGALFFDVYHRNEILSRWHLLVLALLMSFLAMARTDSVLIFIPMAVWAYLMRTKVSFPARVMLGVAGLLPFAIWTLFSLLYYGFPFPNTYNAKLYTGIPLADYVTSGLWYYPTSWLIDPLLMLVPVLFVAMAIKDRRRFMIPLLVGLSAYCIYVVSIGGDFMAGRHLTQQYFLSLCGIAYMVRCCRSNSETVLVHSKDWRTSRETIVILLALAIIGIGWNMFVAPYVNKNWAYQDFTLSAERTAIDERYYYLSMWKDVPLYIAVLHYACGGEERQYRDRFQYEGIVRAKQRGVRGLCIDGGGVLFGRDVFAVSDLDMYLTDSIALQDPLLARLKVDVSRHWRVGHAARDVPAGYHETLASGDNQLLDSSLHEYYDKLLIIMKAPLLDKERLLTILHMNLGDFDYLLERYWQLPRVLNDLELAFRELNIKKNAVRALELLDNCLSVPAIYPSNVVHFCRGCVYEDLEHDYRLAEKEYELAVRGGLTKELVPCADRLARLIACRGELDSAIELWEVAAKLDPGNDEIQWNLSVARKKKQNVK